MDYEKNDIMSKHFIEMATKILISEIGPHGFILYVVLSEMQGENYGDWCEAIDIVIKNRFKELSFLDKINLKSWLRNQFEYVVK